MVVEIRKVLLWLVMLVLAACGGGGGDPGTVNPPPAPPPSAGTGTLEVVVSGLPTGTVGAVRVNGPNNFVQELTQSQALSNLVPGTYSIGASPVSVGATVYSPIPATQSAVVNGGATTSATVAYSSAALSLVLTEVARNLSFPTYLAAPPGDERLFILERAGRVRVLQRDGLQDRPYLDISNRVLATGEGGLLSIAFDPRFAFNGYFYLYYTDFQQNIVIERYRAGPTPDLADPTSGLVILRIPHPVYINHYGGQVAFGPDGYLYLGTGDGGGAGDPMENAQDLASLLGKLLRIDVAQASPTRPYTIPPTNPYVADDGRPEIWAHGLRNPWRFSFDAGQLYLSDVGQARREEVNIVSASQGGLNYGWDVMEGTLCHEPALLCDRAGLTLPAFEYDHGENEANGCSIVGGHVYRGRDIPELTGRYFYSDFCGGYLRSFLPTASGVVEQRDWGLSPGRVVSFGQDAAGELYLLSADGVVYKIGRAAAP